MPLKMKQIEGAANAIQLDLFMGMPIGTLPLPTTYPRAPDPRPLPARPWACPEETKRSSDSSRALYRRRRTTPKNRPIGYNDGFNKTLVNQP